MGKLKVCNLSLEVTRRCNMNCEHCLRGDAQNMDADLALIPKIFAGIDDIDTITFTGGEPALNTAYIKAVVDYVIEHKIPVHGCFVATNGKIYSQELVDCVRRLWEKEQSYGDQFISPLTAPTPYGVGFLEKDATRPSLILPVRGWWCHRGGSCSPLAGRRTLRRMHACCATSRRKLYAPKHPLFSCGRWLPIFMRLMHSP